jgi:hypothetical protein
MIADDLLVEPAFCGVIMKATCQLGGRMMRAPDFSATTLTLYTL